MSHQPIRTLLVEDNPADAHFLLRMFADGRRLIVSHAETLGDAIILLGQQRFDVALLDLNLPDSRGLATVHRLQENQADLPIIVMSGLGAADLGLAREAIREGAQDFIFKSDFDAPLVERSVHIAVERKRLELHRIRWARHDELTGLGNLMLLEEHFARAVVRAQRTGMALALMAIELDNIVELIEEHGGDFADQVVRAVARRLNRHLRRGDTLCRHRSRSFAVLVEGMTLPDDAELVANKLLTRFEAPFEIEGQPIQVRASIGIVHILPSHGDLPAMLEAAERAVQQASLAGGRRHEFGSFAA
ncbi:MAG: diguanylate cyclase domain-containing protein [Geminicoccaceae bacterium]